MDREAGMSVLDAGGRSAQGRRSFLPLLGAAAQQMLELHRRWSERPDAVAAEIDRRLESTAMLPREGAGERLVLLLRLRDLHRYVEVDPELRTFKLALLDAMLRQREPARRWNEARGLIGAHLGALLNARPDEAPAALKRELSSPGGRLGRVLRLCALLNLEATGEMPPPNLALRFVRGRFPEHVWETRQAVNASATTGAATGSTGVSWQPTALLARWEYLAAEVMEHVFRGPTAAGGPAWDGGSGRPGWSGRDAPSPVAVRERTESQGGPDTERVYCRLEVEDTAQLPLLPVEPGTLLPELMRHVERKLGAEGVRQAALVFAASASTPEGTPFNVNVAAFGFACGPATRRETRDRARRLDAVLKLLGKITVQRVRDAEVEAGSKLGGRIHTTRLLTVIGWEGVGADAEQVPERLFVLADRVLWNEAGRPLGEGFADLPGGVLALSPREYPGAVLLAAYTRQQFERKPGVAIEVTAERLIQDVGLATKTTPNSLESLKRDLHRLQELGVLGRWRMLTEGGVRKNNADPMLRLEGPQRLKRLGGANRSEGKREAGLMLA